MFTAISWKNIYTACCKKSNGCAISLRVAPCNSSNFKSEMKSITSYIITICVWVCVSPDLRNRTLLLEFSTVQSQQAHQLENFAPPWRHLRGRRRKSSTIVFNLIQKHIMKNTKITYTSRFGACRNCWFNNESWMEKGQN